VSSASKVQCSVGAVDPRPILRQNASGFASSSPGPLRHVVVQLHHRLTSVPHASFPRSHAEYSDGRRHQDWVSARPRFSFGIRCHGAPPELSRMDLRWSVDRESLHRRDSRRPKFDIPLALGRAASFSGSCDVKTGAFGAKRPYRSVPPAIPVVVRSKSRAFPTNRAARRCPAWIKPFGWMVDTVTAVPFPNLRNIRSGSVPHHSNHFGFVLTVSTGQCAAAGIAPFSDDTGRSAWRTSSGSFTAAEHGRHQLRLGWSLCSTQFSGFRGVERFHDHEVRASLIAIC